MVAGEIAVCMFLLHRPSYNRENRLSRKTRVPPVRQQRDEQLEDEDLPRDGADQRKVIVQCADAAR